MVRITSGLRLYVDRAEEKDWQKYLPTGIFYGVNTNPKLLNQTGIGFLIDRLANPARTAFELGANEIHLQVWGCEMEQMLKVARELAMIDQLVMVKVPITTSGILCTRKLIAKGLNVTMATVHSAQQVLIAIALCSSYAAPFPERMTDGGLNGIEEVTSMGRIVVAMDSPLQLLVASIRQAADLKTLAERGLNTLTLLAKIIEDSLIKELTRQAVISFE